MPLKFLTSYSEFHKKKLVGKFGGRNAEENEVRQKYTPVYWEVVVDSIWKEN